MWHVLLIEDQNERGVFQRSRIMITYMLIWLSLSQKKKKKKCIDRLFSKNGRMPGGAGRRTSTSFEAINASSATGIPNLVR